jgi:hypothetical protein
LETRPCDVVASYTPLGRGPNEPGAPRRYGLSRGIMGGLCMHKRGRGPRGMGHWTGAIRLEWQVFELAREYFGLDDKGDAR